MTFTNPLHEKTRIAMRELNQRLGEVILEHIPHGANIKECRVEHAHDGRSTYYYRDKPFLHVSAIGCTEVNGHVEFSQGYGFPA